MSISPDNIINYVCEALELDRDRLIAENRGNQKYRDARLILTYLLRKKIVETKIIRGTTQEGKRVLMEEDKPITYIKIAYLLKRTKPQSAMASELACKDLLKSDKEFKAKYDLVINLLDNNVNIA